MSIKLTAGERGSACVKLGEAALAARYAQEAKTASENARAAAVHPPVIGENGNWQIWYQGSGYVDSGVQAEGPVGPQGPQGPEDTESVRVVSQTWSAEQQAQARSNIGAADVDLYTDNGIIVSDYPNTGSEGQFIILSEPINPSSPIETPTSYEVGTSLIIGRGKYNTGVSLGIGAPTSATGNFATLDWIAPYLEEVVVSGTTYKRFNPSMGTSNKQTGAMAVGTCKIEAPAGSGSWALGYINVCTGGYAFVAGGGCLASHNYASAIGARLKTPQASSMVCGKLNNPISTDRFEVGNGTDNTHRSNAFRVTDGGAAIAKNSLGIEKSDGSVVSITAAQLEALLNLL